MHRPKGCGDGQRMRLEVRGTERERQMQEDHSLKTERNVVMEG